MAFVEVLGRREPAGARGARRAVLRGHRQHGGVGDDTLDASAAAGWPTRAIALGGGPGSDRLVGITQTKVADIRQIPSPIPPQGTAANDGNNSFRTGTIPTVGVTDDGTVHLAWGQWDGSSAEVRYVRSTDGGATFGPQLAMNDVSTGHQFFPSIATSGDNVHVSWYDGRLDPPAGAITKLDVFYNRSGNAGARFTADRRVTDVSHDPNQVSRFPVFCQAFIGDYLDIDAVGGQVATIWNDNRNVVSPLTPAECRSFLPTSTDPLIQPRLDSGSLDQEAFVDLIPQP